MQPNSANLRIETTAFLAWGDLPLSLLLGMLALLGCNTAGFILHRLAGRKGMPLIGFSNALSGLLLLTAAFATWTTGGRSILSPVPLLLAGVLILRPESPERVRGEWLAGMIGLFGFVAFYAGAFAADSRFIGFPSGDLAYYARLAEHLLLNGQENRLVDIPAPAVPVVQPYHWGDTWLLALLTRAFPVRGIYALPLLAYPLLASILSMGIFRILRTGMKAPAILPALLAPLLLFTPVISILPASLDHGFNLLAVPLAQYPKLLNAGIFMCAALLLLHEGARSAGAWMLAIAGLFHTPVLPAALSGIVFLAWRPGPGPGSLRRRRLKMLPPFLVLAGWPMLLYAVVSGPEPFFSLADVQAAGYCLHPALLLPALANLAMLLPGALLLTALRRQAGPLGAADRNTIAVLGVLAGAGFVAWLLSYDLIADSGQFFTGAIPLIAIGMLLLAIPGFARRKRHAWLALCVLLPVFGLFRDYRFGRNTYLTDRISQADYRRLQGVSAVSRPWDSLKAVVIKSPVEPDRSATRLSVVFYPLELLAFEHPQYSAASLQAPFLSNAPAGVPNAAELARMKWHTPVMQFARERGLSAVPPRMQVFFYVKDRKPDVLIIANDAVVPKELEPFLGADSVQLESKPYRVLPLYHGRQ